MTLSKLKFIHPTTAQLMRLAAILLTIANTLLAVGATLTGVPDSLKWLTPYWPCVYGVALGIHQLASTFGVSPDAALASQLQSDAVLAAHVAGIVAGTKEALKQISADSSTVTPQR